MTGSATLDDAVDTGTRDRWVRSASVWELLAVGVFTLWIAWPFVAPGGYVTDYDTIRYSGPNLVATFRAWSEHRLPLWEPGIFGGTAFAGNLQTAVFYPLKVLAWPLGAPAAMGALTAVHLFVLAAGMWWLARRTLRLVAPAGLVAAVVMVGSGTTMVRAVRFEQIAVVAWIPWLLVALDAVVAAPERRRARPVAAGAAATALVLLSGHPNQAMVAGALALLWTAVRLRDRRPDRPGAAVARVAAAGGLGAGIAALPLVLAVPLVRHLAIPPGVMVDEAAQDRHTLAPARIISAFLGDAVSAGGPVERPTLELPVFVGAAALVLAVFGAAVWCAEPERGNRATGRGLVAGALIGVLLALGPAFGIYRLAALVVPGFGNGRVPVRWLLVTTVAVAVLAAAGVSELVTRGPGQGGARRARFGAVAAVMALVAVAAPAPPWGPHEPSVGARLGWLVAAGLVAGAGAFAGRHPDPRSRRWAGAAVAALIVLELGLPARASYAWQLRTERSFADRATAVDAYLAAQGARALVLGRSDVNANLTAGWRTLDGYDGGLWLTDRYVNAAERLSDGSYWVVERLGEHIGLPLDAGELADMGVRFAVYDTLATTRSRDELLAGWSGPVVADDTREVWENPRFRGEARFAGAAPASDMPGTVHRPEPGVIEVATAAPSTGGRLVVAEQALPGWAVTVDGEPAPFREADGFSLAVDLPAGAHVVRFGYSPPAWRAGAAVSLLCLALALGLGLMGHRPIRRALASSSGGTGRPGTMTA